MSSTISLPERRKPINKLNHLTGKDWIKFTKSWFIHNPPRRDRAKIVHPAGFPETLVRGFVEFFTKRDMWVLDPFLGTGSTLLAARALAEMRWELRLILDMSQLLRPGCGGVLGRTGRGRSF